MCEFTPTGIFIGMVVRAKITLRSQVGILGSREWTASAGKGLTK